MAEMDIFQDLLFSHNDLEAYGDFYTHPWVQHDDDWTAFEEDVMCSFWPEFCSFLISAIVDCDLDLVNFERMDIYFDNKSGSSTKNMSHLAQMLVSGKFQEFDYGKKNFEVYG